MKCLSLGMTVVAMFVAGFVALHAQVKPGQGINSPFATYEDANLIDPGAFAIGVYVYGDRTTGGTSLYSPGVAFSFGLNRRLELSGFGAAALSPDDKNLFTTEPDDSYLSLKLLLVPKRRFRPALAVKPTLELLGNASGADRAHFVLPVILQKDIRLCDLALTAGYVTRGVAFSALKCEWNIGSRVTPLAVVQASRATKDLRTISDLGLNRTEVRGSGGLGIDISPHWSVFLEVGRTLGRTDKNSSRLNASANVSFTGRLWGRSESADDQGIRTRP